jgi:hypothetical protein
MNECVVTTEFGDVWKYYLSYVSLRASSEQCQVDTPMLQHGRNGAQGSASIQLHELVIVSRLDGVSYEHHAANSAASTSSSIAGVRNALIAEGKRHNF